MPKVLGIDIDEHTVRAVLVRTSLRKIEVLRYAEAPIVLGEPGEGSLFGGPTPGDSFGAPSLPEPAGGFDAPGLPAEQQPLSQGYPDTDGAPGAEGSSFGQPPPDIGGPAAPESAPGAGFGAPEGASSLSLGEHGPDPGYDEPRAPSLDFHPDVSGESDILVPPETRARRRAIAELVAGLQPRPDQVIAGLDGREASLRVVELPAIAAKKKRVAEVLPVEIDDLLPFDVEELVIDHQLIDDPKGRATVRVMATAARKVTVAERLADLGGAGVDPRELAVGSMALDGLVHLVPELQASEGPIAILEMEHQNTELCVIEGGRAVFARSLDGGMDAFREGKRAPIEGRLKRTLGGYRASGAPPLTRVLLCGEATQLAPEIIEWLGPVLDVPIEPLPLPDAPGCDAMMRARYGRAAALAARVAGKSKRLDLRQGEFAQTQAMGELRAHSRLIAICAATLMVAFGFATFARWNVLSSERETLQAQLREVTDDAFDEETSSPTEARELLEGGRRVEDPLPTFTAFDVLDKVSGAIPQEITHDTRRLMIEIDDIERAGRFELQGTVASIAERDTIAANLEAEECFDEVEKGPTSPGPRNEGLNYRLEVTIHCPGDEPIVQEESSRRSRRRNR